MFQAHWPFFLAVLSYLSFAEKELTSSLASCAMDQLCSP